MLHRWDDERYDTEKKGTIRIAFPSAFGVASHVYFNKWKPIDASELILNASTMGNAPDESKLKKGVRKLLVFLHPDKLPRDLI